jgi:SAM-dependent methyltransferase
MTELMGQKLPEISSHSLSMSSLVLSDPVQLLDWERHVHRYEKVFWDNCVNTCSEESKQLAYAKCMGLGSGSESVIDARNKKILDVGGGPVSLLFKTQNLLYGKVIDPIEYPLWVQLRYKEAKIDYVRAKGEDINEEYYDEVWCYNVLQHVIDPTTVLRNAINAVDRGGILRVFDWIDIFPYRLHPHMLTGLYWLHIFSFFIGVFTGFVYCHSLLTSLQSEYIFFFY